MTIDMPRSIQPLRQLWKQAFGDTEEFLDCFFTVAYSPRRCRCVYEGDTLAAMLYWFDCSWGGKKLAYLYAVATAEAFRGRGVCRALMEDSHRHLKEQGYDGSILVPRTPGLFAMYEKMGYRTCCTVQVSSCTASRNPVPLRKIDKDEFAALRRQMLPKNGVIQEQEALTLLDTYAAFYKGDNLLLSAYQENGKCTVSELLGSLEAAPGVLSALGYSEGNVRIPGGQMPFAMYHSLTEDPAAPDYLGIALD